LNYDQHKIVYDAEELEAESNVETEAGVIWNLYSQHLKPDCWEMWRHQAVTLCRCYFQLRAIGQLAAGRARLDKAQGSLQRSHGPSGARMRRLHGNFCPELAM